MRLEAKNLEKSFGEKRVLRGVSFAAESGRALGLLGRNGAGKTTSIRIVMQVFPPDGGEVLLDGERLHTDRVRIGYLPEERGLYPKKPIFEQLVYFGRLAGLSKKQTVQNAERLLKRLEVTQYRDKRLETLSKGNQQKIQLVATLIADPRIVILDEPFSGLDPVNAQLLKDVVRELIAQGKIVLFSSHQMNYIEEFCDDIAILHEGEIALSGALRDIKRSFPRNVVDICGTDLARVQTALRESAPQWIINMDLQDDTLAVTLRDPADKAALYRALEPCADVLDAVSVREPSLNEIFVHYTKGASV